MLLDPIVAAINGLPLDAHERRAAAQLLRVQAAGERIARDGARAQAGIAPDRVSRRFLLRQSRQEGFHAVLFDRLARTLDSEDNVVREADIPASLVRIRTALAEAIAGRNYTDAIVIQHVALEGLGHAVLERLDEELPAFGEHFGRLRRLILAQEDAHYAFGARMLVSQRHDGHVIRLTRRMLDEAESLLIAIAPQFHALGGDVADVMEPLRRRALASAGVT